MTSRHCEKAEGRRSNLRFEIASALLGTLPCNDERSNGFLLIEALVALLILSIALVASLGGIGAALRVAGRGEEMTKSILEDEKRLFQTEIKGNYEF